MTTAGIHSWIVRPAFQAGLLTIAFALSAHLGIEISRHTNNVAAVWLPNGIALAMMLLARPRDWPLLGLAAAAGNLAVNLYHGDSLPVTLGFTACNLSEILLAYGLLRWRGVGASLLDSPLSLLTFLGIAATSAALSASLGAGLIAISFDADYWTVWRTWWVGDAVGLIMVTPLVICWICGAKPTLHRLLSLEPAILGVAFIVTTIALFYGDLGNDVVDHVLPLLTLPFQIWAALRFGSRGATLASAFVAMVGIASIVEGSSPMLGHQDPVSAILALQAILIATSLSAFLLVASLNERRQSEVRIKAAEARLHDAIDSLGEGFAIFDHNDRLALCNDRYRTSYADAIDLIVPGVRFEDLIRAGARRGITSGSADDAEAWIAERLQRHQNPGEPIEQQHASGRWYKITERRTGEGGTVGIWTDITEIKKQERALRASEQRLLQQEEILRASETRYRRLIEVIPDAVFVTRNDEIVFVSQAALSMFGATDKSQLLGRSPFDFIHPDDHPTAAARMRTIALRQESSPAYEERGLRLDGSVFDTEVVVTRLPNIESSDIVAIIRDVSERKLTELQLLESQKMEAVGRLTGGIAHEFNNLLTVVIGNLDFALTESEEEPSGDRLRKVLGKALDAAERGSKLTQQLLAHSRKQPLSPRPVDPRTVVNEMKELLGSILGAHVELRMKLRPGLWTAHVDPGQLENALLNLVLNARDAMPDGGVLTIETSNSHLDENSSARNGEISGGDYVLLSITDTGRGMAPEVMNRAFEPFFTTKDPGKGTGLGLSMVYGFAKQSGGHLRISSELGRGTTVRFYLPRSPQSTDTTDLAPKKSARTESEKPTILVVEDNPDLCDVVVRQLSGIGYRVLSAADGKSATKILESDEDLDLLLTDVIMPGGMNGREVAEESKRLRPWLRVLFMSGYSADAMIRENKLAPDVALIKKPFQRHELAKRVREILDEPAH